MGKGFENYMSKKWFHPTNIDNMKRVYAAKQKESAFVQRQSDLKAQYEREQEIFGNKQLMGDEKARLGLSFIYQAPASLADQEKKKQNDAYNKKEEEYGTSEKASHKTDKVRNIQCLKCKRWGHANTDKSCPLYGKSKLDVDFIVDSTDVKEAKTEETLKIVDDYNEPKTSMSQPEISLEMIWLTSLPSDEKKALLKRLRKLLKKSKWRKKANIA